MTRPRTPARPPGPSAPKRPAPASSDLAGLVLLGEFGRAHGLRGEVRLKSYTAEPQAIAAYGPLTGADGRTLTIRSLRPSGAAPDLLVARVEGVEDRDAAEALNRLAVYAPRDRLGPVDDPDEFFTADLVGLAVADGAGTVLGHVVDVPNYGGGDILEIRPLGGGATALLPFTKAFVPAIDMAARRITVDPPDDLFAPAGPEPDPEA